jgi:predicted component of type VI protein secretion system
MVGAGDPPFPSEPPTLTLSVEGERAMLGRIRPGHPVDVDLPLSGAAADPAVSHHQSEFVRDGATWTVRDADSSNGTWINDADAPLAAGAVHPLADGDRIFVGAWTCLRVTLDGAPPPPSPTPTP